MAGYHLSYGHRAVGLFFEYSAKCPRAALVARGFFSLTKNLCMVNQIHIKGLVTLTFSQIENLAVAAARFFYGINCIPENICLVCAQVNGRGCMDVWTLYFLVTFVTGQSLLMENNDVFETKSDCMAAGAVKGESVTINLANVYGIPAHGFYYCSVNGLEV